MPIIMAPEAKLPRLPTSDDAVPPEFQRQHRFRRVAFLEIEGDEGDQSGGCQGGERSAAQAAALHQGDHQDAAGEQQQERAGPVDAVLAVAHLLLQERANHDDGGDADGDVDPEDERQLMVSTRKAPSEGPMTAEIPKTEETRP